MEAMRWFVWVNLAVFGCAAFVALIGTMHAAWRLFTGLGSEHEVDCKIGHLALVCMGLVINLAIAHDLLGK
ncbi:hypothetical protein ACIA49_38975 [Kribbella sp. NPDC051587]|uniref:hypothetical protein n=1 Tax=Kribbella sp. NPDC051587 TaxID=3364119 RepID=UPI0037AACEE0